MKLKGKVALITGAGRNLGRAIALDMAKEGCKILLNTRKNRENIRAVAEEIASFGVKVLQVVADISDANSVNEMVKQAEVELGRVDILVNNAVQRMDSPFLELSLEKWNTVLNINLTGPFNCSKAVIPGMKSRRWGRIINFSGLAANIGFADRIGICTVKSGIVGFTKGLAREFGPWGITVNSISPGAIEVIRDRGYDMGHLSRVEKITAVGRQGKPEEIASLCVYLCTEEASYITGQNICVNGGAYM